MHTAAVNNNFFVQNLLNLFVKTLSIISIIHFVRDYHIDLDTHPFALWVLLSGPQHYMRDRGFIRLSAAGSWAQRGLYCSGRDAVCNRCCIDCTDFLFVRMIGKHCYEIFLLEQSAGYK